MRAFPKRTIRVICTDYRATMLRVVCFPTHSITLSTNIQLHVLWTSLNSHNGQYCNSYALVISRFPELVHIVFVHYVIAVGVVGTRTFCVFN